MRKMRKHDPKQVVPTSTITARPKEAFEKVTRRYITDEAKKEAFLVAFSKMGTIRKAAESIGISYITASNWIDTDPDFAKLFKVASNCFAELLEREAIKRATEGHKQVVIHHGEVVMVWVDHKGRIVGPRNKHKVKQVPLYEAKKSDQLLMFLLKGLKPEKYRENMTVDQNIKGEPMKTFINVDMSRV